MTQILSLSGELISQAYWRWGDFWVNANSDFFFIDCLPGCCVFQALIVVVILGWLFVPIYIKAGVNRTHRPHVGNTLNVTHLKFKVSPPDQSVASRPQLRVKERHKWTRIIHYLWVCLGGHHARVPEEEVWRTTYPYLPLRAVPLSLCFHQDLSKSQWH